MLKTLGIPVHSVLSKVNSLEALFGLSLEEMIAHFGVAGKKLYEFSNKSVFS